MRNVVKRNKDGEPVIGADGKPVVVRVKAYEGTPRPLGYLASGQLKRYSSGEPRWPVSFDLHHENDEIIEEGDSPATFDDKNVSIVRASRIDDRNMLGDFGMEQLTARGSIGAIIHDKLVVIDPRLDDCHVILGSHNLGFKASYSNDEHMLIVSGNRALAETCAVHILDVCDHYRFRSIEPSASARVKAAGPASSIPNRIGRMGTLRVRRGC